MLRRILLALCLPLLLLSCGKGRVSGIPPEEVLRRAANASRNLASAAYTISGDFTLEGGGQRVAWGRGEIEGALGDAGRQAHFTLEGELTLERRGAPVRVDGELEVVVAGENEVYLKVHSLSDDPPGSLWKDAMLQGLREQWWLLPPGPEKSAPGSVTAHPRILQAQASVVRVIRDHGIGRLGDREVYHEEVAVDPAKLVAFLREVALEQGETLSEADLAPYRALQARGDLWIDTETFLIHALEWDIGPMDLRGGGTLSLSFHADLRDHNGAPAITPPSGAAPFSAGGLLPLPPAAELLPVPPAEPPPAPPLEAPNAVPAEDPGALLPRRLP
jgi:hypothetical protein